MLQALRSLLEQQGYLSGIIIDEAEHLPSSSCYRGRFGSLLRAYTLIGYNPDRNYSYVEINKALRERHPALVLEALEGIRSAGGAVERLPNDLILVNDEFTASVVLARCAATPAGACRWVIRLDTGLLPDITVVARLDATNAHITDYYLLPRLDLTVDRLRLAEANGASIDCYRFESLDYLFELARRMDLEEVA
jgi:hypothetical protein